MFDLSLMSWNILAPCWVKKEWYPSLYHLANDYQMRMDIILSKILSLNCNIVMIQEAQENLLHLIQEKLGEKYFFEFTQNNPSASPIANGLVTLIDKNWIYAKEIKIINGILDPIKGEAIQIIHIPSKNLSLINLHLDFIDPVSQAKMVKDKFHQLTGSTNSISVLGGDLNATKDRYDQFEWIGYKNIFDESNKDEIIPTYYPDQSNNKRCNTSIDHIFYDPNVVQCLQSGKGFDRKDQTLEDCLRILGSDHIYIWANFNFILN